MCRRLLVLVFEHIQQGLNLNKSKVQVLLVLSEVWMKLKLASPALAWGGAFMLFASLITSGLSVFDTRLFQGVSVWHKPWKFQISTVLYWWSLAWFISFLGTNEQFSLSRRFIVWMSLTAGLFEVVYISWQGALGLASHYNISSPFYGAMYTAMGVFAVLLTSTSGVLGYKVLRADSQTYATSVTLRHAIGWGLIISSVLGIVTGGILGGRTSSGGHWVGGSTNDALGLAMLNWSRDGGDLRVAHFFALHAMQIIPVMAILFLWLTPNMNPNTSKRFIWLLAVGYTGFCTYTLMQALSGIPFLAKC
jgi:hypothetical protein